MVPHNVGCQGSVQLGGLIPGYPWKVPLVKARKSFLFNGGSLKVEIRMLFLVSVMCKTYYHSKKAGASSIDALGQYLASNCAMLT